MRLGPKIQALLRCALTRHWQRREDGILPAEARERRAVRGSRFQQRRGRPDIAGRGDRVQREEGMNKREMADRLAVGTGLNKAAARDAVDGVFEAISEALANGDEVRIAGFGTFSVKSRPARTGRNPRTGEPVSISASRSPSFKAGKSLKDSLNADQKTYTEDDRESGPDTPRIDTLWKSADYDTMTDLPSLAA